MILIVTNKEDYTADFLILGLKRINIDYFRLNTEDFPSKVGIKLNIDQSNINGSFLLENQEIYFKDIKSVWYRRPVASIPSPKIRDPLAKRFVIRESRETLEGLWRILPSFWVSRPDKLRTAESKILQLKVAAKIGFVIPSTLITTSSTSAKSFHRQNSQSIICKPLYDGRIEREDNVSLIFTNFVDKERAEQFNNIALAPTLLQPNIPKKLEIRATVVGKHVFAVELHSQEIENAVIDWRRVNSAKIRHLPHELPQEINWKCVELVKLLGIKFGAIDLILTPDDQYVFLEINPNGQWAWIQQTCPEIQIREALIELLVNGIDNEKE